MINWSIKPFDQLTQQELYAILRLRSEVFVVEQNCVFLDMDNKDQHCEHIMAWRGSLLAAYSRIVPAGISYVESSIGRIVTSPAARGSGIGRELLVKSIDYLYGLYGRCDIRIGAQYYLKKFYTSFGFVQKGEIYLEDGIEHIEMLLSKH
ncbi:MAG TPA: GNAT family N-acetyltransferase [Puia sp.]|uniref:GNAT family N-acetyltransferase n=1 Tax=Puia sp. TaxID=2045100 RepID=UPI002C556700|nr:GNAT family N-acetyltransferase [Puia sp.]HVU99363.1 GNAT family N-acetyltransferase [Puia sp.]